MPPLPKRRHSTRRQGKGRAKIHLTLPNLVNCPKCGNLKLAHTACLDCLPIKKKAKPLKKQ